MQKNIENPVYRLFRWVFTSIPRWPYSGPACLVISIACFLSLSFYFWNFVQDDAYIFLRYADQFSRGSGFVFNVGERVEGCTSFLWLLFAVIPFKAGLPPLETLKVLSMFFGVLSLVMLYRISRVYFNPGHFIFFPLLLFSVNPSLALWSQGGMGTTLNLFLILTHFYYLLRFWQDPSRKSLTMSALALSLASMTRPETPIFFAASVFVLLLTCLKSRCLKDFALFGGVFVLVFSVFQIWRIMYFGELFPNTYYAKVSVGSTQFRYGLGLFKTMLSTNLYLVFTAIALTCLSEKSFHPGTLVFLLSFVLYTLYYIRIGTDILPHHRLYIHIFPLMYLLGFHVFENIGRYLNPTDGRLGLAFLFSCLVTAFSLYAMGYSVRNGLDIREFRNVRKSLEGVHGEIGRYLQSNHDPGDVVVLTDVGATSYYARDLIVRDFLGLTDRTVSRIFHDCRYNPWLQHLSYSEIGFEERKRKVFQRITDYFYQCSPRYVVANISIPVDHDLSSRMKACSLALPRSLDRLITDYIVFSQYHSVFSNSDILSRYKVIRMLSYNDFYFLALLELKKF